MYFKKQLVYLILPLAAAACKPKPRPTPDTQTVSTPSDTAKTAKAGSALENEDSSTDKTTKPAMAGSRSLIIPGKSIGKTHLNESMENIYRTLGKPDSSDAAMSSALGVWFAGHQRGSYKTSIFSSLRQSNHEDAAQYAKRILVTSPYFKTAEGIGVNSSIDQIRQHYTLKAGNGYADSGRQIAVYDDIIKGISFEVDPVTRKCIGVIIQAPGTEAGSSLNLN